jgi:hypothetical protein
MGNIPRFLPLAFHHRTGETAMAKSKDAKSKNSQNHYRKNKTGGASGIPMRPGRAPRKEDNPPRER